ncbi:monocarboxylate transporter 13 [Aplysia californica]|uniref:Monocarboxylate transporter 13 n=1 Tax=Aplysia californica TaxID=6500 RepID=A0ABM0K2T6_APLCA|nr:monocarboxylate transporter 13 [Aplysia californica]
MTDKANLGEMKKQDEMEREKEIEENEEKTTKEDAPFDGVPKDRGWSWVICIGVFVTMTSLTGFNRISSVLFVDYMELYQKPASVITFLFTCQSLCSSVATILVSNILMARFTVRRIAVAASLLNCLTTFLISFAPNIYVFLLLFCFKGFAFGALLVGPMSLIGFYFKKRRSLAASIANSGVCVSFIAFPPITNQLR